MSVCYICDIPEATSLRGGEKKGAEEEGITQPLSPISVSHVPLMVDHSVQKGGVKEMSYLGETNDCISSVGSGWVEIQFEAINISLFWAIFNILWP